MKTKHFSTASSSLSTNKNIRSTPELPGADLNGVICTKHAEDRIKQRGIKREWMSLLLDYGRETYQKGKRTYSVSLDKAGIKKIKRSYGNAFDLSKLRRLYLILTEDYIVITCAYR
jgi:hypothetical protein